MVGFDGNQVYGPGKSALEVVAAAVTNPRPQWSCSIGLAIQEAPGIVSIFERFRPLQMQEEDEATNAMQMLSEYLLNQGRLSCRRCWSRLLLCLLGVT